MKIKGDPNRSTHRIPLTVLVLLLMIVVTAGAAFAQSPSDSMAGDRAAASSAISGKAQTNAGIVLRSAVSPTPCTPVGTATPSVIQGSLVAADPDQAGRIFRDDPGSTCAVPQTCAIFDAIPRNYDVYTFTNTSGSPVCVTIELNAQTCVGTQFLQSAVYSPAFVPTSLCQNFVGDMGASPNPVKSYSVTIPAGATFQVTVNETTSNALCPAYTLTIIGLPGSCATPIVPTATATVCAVNSIVGSLTSSDPVQMGRLWRDTPTGCATNNCPGVMDTLPRHYDAYQFINNSTSSQCINVTLNTAGCAAGKSPSGAGFADSAGYVGALAGGTGGFSPLDLCTNYRGDIGLTQTFTGTYSFVVGPLESFTIVVNEENPNQGCASYTLAVRGCGITLCTSSFSDVPPGSTFYTFIRCLSCKGIISGYNDGTFRPNAEVTRGQLAKIVSNAAGFSDDPGAQIFEDVPSSNPFYQWINRLTRRGIMSGYTCGGLGEPCVPPTDRPYFRWGANATRGQTSKIVANAANFNEPPSGQTFEDVPPSHSFYEWIQRLASRNIMQGYPCGSLGEPCVPPENRHYFRPFNNVTRGQSAKIVANAFYPGCNP
ncbi:MAG: S-layer homology domain-containing protein [Chloroflexia bacterium]